MTFKKGFMRRLNGLLLGLLCGVERLVSNSFKGIFNDCPKYFGFGKKMAIRDTFSKFIPILWVRQSIVKGCS